MMPHHLKLLLVALAFPVAILLGISVHQGYTAYFHTPTVQPANQTRIQYPDYHLVARNALARFKALPLARQNRLRENLNSNLVDFPVWIESFKAQNFAFVCLGENHNDRTRLFLAQTFFAAYQPDVLMLEATGTALARMKDSWRAYVPLLGADISSILKALPATTEIVGIEQSERQKTVVTQNRSQSRDQAILANFQSHFQSQKRNLVLFGALHCGDFEDWFYGLASRTSTLGPSHRKTNLRVLGEHQDGALEAFIYFLDEIGLKKANFAISKTGNLDSWIYDAFAVFTDQTLKHYDSVIVFRET